jgi:acyl-CoA reductase-like NAD-dependent aldehyde dehydrogenase
VAPDYLLLPEEYERDFVKLAYRITSSMYSKYVANADYTRIVNEGQYRRLVRLVENARRLGAEIIEINPAGDECNEINRVFPLTLVLGVREDMLIMQEEIFGPVLPVVRYRELNDAIAYINERPRALALYYFDENASRIQTVLERTIVGGVTINDCMMHVGQPSLPFGGVGASGFGYYHGFHGFERFSRKTGVFVQGRRSPLSFLRPPYSQRTRRILNFLIGSY